MRAAAAGRPDQQLSPGAGSACGVTRANRRGWRDQSAHEESGPGTPSGVPRSALATNGQRVTRAGGVRSVPTVGTHTIVGLIDSGTGSHRRLRGRAGRRRWRLSRVGLLFNGNKSGIPRNRSRPVSLLEAPFGAGIAASVPRKGPLAGGLSSARPFVCGERNPVVADGEDIDPRGANLRFLLGG